MTELPDYKPAKPETAVERGRRAVADANRALREGDTAGAAQIAQKYLNPTPDIWAGPLITTPGHSSSTTVDRGLVKELSAREPELAKQLGAIGEKLRAAGVKFDGEVVRDIGRL